jgi:exosortase
MDDFEPGERADGEAGPTETGGPRSGYALTSFDVLVIIGLVVVFAPAVASLAEVWSRLEYYSHGYLVPLAALWAATSQREILPTLPVERHPKGGLALGASVLALFIGQAASIVALQGLALVAAVASAIYLTRGPRWLKALSFPIGYLMFMVPVPDAWLSPLIVELQSFVSSISIEIMHVFSIPVLRSGNVMELPGGERLFVAEACSGITSIVTLIPLAVFLAYFTERKLGRRLLLVAAVIPLAMLGNLLRVLITVMVATRYGSAVATADALHGWAGIMTYVLGCLALLGVGALMRHLFPERSPA